MLKWSSSSATTISHRSQFQYSVFASTPIAVTPVRLSPAASLSSVVFQSTVSLASHSTLCYATALFWESTMSTCSGICSLGQNSHARKSCSWHKRLSLPNRMSVICTSLLVESCMPFCQWSVPRCLAGQHSYLPCILRRLCLSVLRQFVGHSLLPSAIIVQEATGPGIASFALQCARIAVKQDTFACLLLKGQQPATSMETTQAFTAHPLFVYAGKW